MELLIQPEKLNQQLQRENPPLVVDVRGETAYKAGHLPGAWHIPGEELQSRMAEIPKDRPVVFY